MWSTLEIVEMWNLWTDSSLQNPNLHFIEIPRCSVGKWKLEKYHPRVRASHIFSVKDQLVNILGFGGHMVSITATQRCLCTVKAANKTGVCKIRPVGQIWPVTCFYTACQPRMIFTLLNGWKKNISKNHILWRAKIIQNPNFSVNK